MGRVSFLSGVELWPMPGFSAFGALDTPAGPGLVALSGPPRTEQVVLLAGESVPLVRGLAAHACRQGLGVVALTGAPDAHRGETLLRAAGELARLRGASRVAIAAHGPWVGGAVLAAIGEVEALAVLDPAPVNAAIDPQRLAGIPLWISSGTDSAKAARDLHARGRHPRSLVELAAVPQLEHAVNDVAASLVPFLCHALRSR